MTLGVAGVYKSKRRIRMKNYGNEQNRDSKNITKVLKNKHLDFINPDFGLVNRSIKIVQFKSCNSNQLTVVLR